MEAADLHQHCAHSTAATRTQTPPPASGAIQVVLGRSFLVCMPVGTETLSPNEKNTRRSAFSVGEPPATTGRRHRRGSSHFESKGPPSRSAAPRKRPGAYAPSRCVRSTASPGRLRSVLRMRSREPPRRGNVYRTKVSFKTLRLRHTSNTAPERPTAPGGVAVATGSLQPLGKHERKQRGPHLYCRCERKREICRSPCL